MSDLVLLTGASSGIGREMARLLAARKYDLILVARNEQKLQLLKDELQQNHQIRVYLKIKDLSKVNEAQALYREIKGQGLSVRILVNNAGVGVYGEFSETSLKEELSMMELNMSALVVLTKLFLQDMKADDYGRILNVASLLSFFPFPYYAVYAATKAFVLSFSEALRAELSDTNISVTALCPGPTDTGFTTPEMLQTNAYKGNPPVEARAVAEVGVRQLLDHNTTTVVGFTNKLIVFATKHSPRWINLRITKHLASQATS